MKVVMETIPHDQHRYPTVGDWFVDTNTGELVIRVSKMSNWRYEFLVQYHELTEATLCLDRGIDQDEVDRFDKWYELQGKAGEPGDDPAAPYRAEHFFATTLERLMAAELGVDWQLYDNEINKLFEEAKDGNETAVAGI